MFRSAAAVAVASRDRILRESCRSPRDPVKFRSRMCNVTLSRHWVTASDGPAARTISGGNESIFHKNYQWATTIAIAGAVGAALVQDQEERAELEIASSEAPTTEVSFPIHGELNHGIGNASQSFESLQLPNMAEKKKDLPPGKSGLHNRARSTATSVRALNHALQQHYERQKMHLGKLLQEFELLAEESLSDLTDLTEASTAKEEEPTDAATLSAATQKSIDVTESDLTKLSPTAAWDYIRCLKEGAIFKREDVKRIARAASEVLRQEPTLIDLKERKDELKTVTVVGDLHGHFCSLMSVLGLVHGDSGGESGEAAASGTPWNTMGAIVFNGDFIDRGENSLYVILALLLLKLAYPNHVFLNRGNHEDTYLSTVYGCSEELQARYGDESIDDIWETFCDVFSSLPLCVRTQHAVILHGGLPSENFNLGELQQVTPEDRFKIRSMLEPGNDTVCQLVQNICWSDPRPEDGIEPNEDRGAGMKFGPDIVRRFLSSHGLRHLVRSHEPVDAGYESLECSDSHSAVTVFSAANYPNGEGYNWGAIIRLHSDGTVEPVSFEGPSLIERNEEKQTFAALTEMIAQNQTELEDEFAYMAKMNNQRRKLKSAFSSNPPVKGHMADHDARDDCTMITPGQWADVMSFVLNLHNVDWLSLQPHLAPTVLNSEESASAPRKSATPANGSAHPKLSDTGMIDYRRFLNLHCNVAYGCSNGTNLDANTLEVLHRNHAALLTVFKFLDTDHNGCIDRTEFNHGISLLSKRLPDAVHLGNTDALFDSLDLDGNGTIELEEFERVFQSTKMPYADAVFKLFDADHSGTIDREEFREGVRLMNARLSQTDQIEDSDALFDKLDLDGNGEIDLEEFRKMAHDFFPQL